MIDINNKKFNFYDPIKLIEQDKNIESFFSDIIYILSEKYIPDRETNKIRNQFGNLILNQKNQNLQNSKTQTVFSGFENIISEKIILKIDKNIKDFTLLLSNFILIDVNNHQNFKYVEKILDEILNRRLIPIISHPERFMIFEKENIEKLKEKGILFQLSLGSFASFFGERSSIKSRDYLELGIYDFIASDCTNYNEINDEFLENQISEISKIIGSNKINELIYNNPKNVIDEKSKNDFQILNTKRG